MGNSNGNFHTGKANAVVVNIAPEDRVVGSKKMKGNTSEKRVFTKSHIELMQLLLPVWYSLEPLTIEEISLARASWNLILKDTSEEFQRMKGTPDFEYSSAVVWFFDTFYKRFFDVHPTVKPLFKTGLLTQGRLLIHTNYSYSFHCNINYIYVFIM